MKKLFSILFSIALVAVSIPMASLRAKADTPLSPVIALVVSDYDSSGAINEKSGRGLTSATKGDTIAVSFVLSGVSALECYQISGSFDTDKLSAGYYLNSKWKTGNSDLDNNTIIGTSAQYTNGSFDDSFSYTRLFENPLICIVGFSTSGQVSVSENTTIATVGFRVLRDIENIYDVFTWDNGTMIGVAVDKEEYYLDSGLEIACQHQYEHSTVAPDCENDGYELYSCIYCTNEYRNSYTPATGHSFTFSSKVDSDFSYTCASCGATDSKSADELNAMWDVRFVNKPPQPTTVDDSGYFELVFDGIINAKDFAVLNM